MKKLLLIFLIFLLSISLVFIGRSVKKPSYPLLQLEIETHAQCSGEHLDIEFPENAFMYERFGFYYDENDSCIVIERCWDHFEPINSKSYHIDEVTSEDFERIEPGMTVYQVVELVGIPFRSGTSGISTTDFQTADEKIFRIHWDKNMNVFEDAYEVIPKEN